MALNLTKKTGAAAPALAPATETPAGLDALPAADPKFDPSSNPIVAKVLGADVPGVIVPESDFDDPLIAPLNANGRKLIEVGLAVIPVKGGVALFNPAVVKLEEAQAYADSPKINQLFPVWREVLGQEGAAPGPGGGATASPAAGSMAGAPPQAPSAQKATAAARSRATAMPAMPNTRKAAPAAGSLLNSFTQPVV